MEESKRKWRDNINIEWVQIILLCSGIVLIEIAILFHYQFNISLVFALLGADNIAGVGLLEWIDRKPPT